MSANKQHMTICIVALLNFREASDSMSTVPRPCWRVYLRIFKNTGQCTYGRPFGERYQVSWVT